MREEVGSFEPCHGIHTLVTAERTNPNSPRERHPVFTKVINVQPLCTLETLSNKTKGLVVEESLAARPTYT